MTNQHVPIISNFLGTSAEDKIVPYKSIQEVDKHMPPAGFGARLHVSEDDDLHDGEMEVSDMYAGANGLGACAQVQSLDVNPNRFHRYNCGRV